MRGYSPALTGLAIAPEAFVVMIASLLSGRISARHGPRPAMVGGLALGAAGLLGLIVAGRHTPYALLVAPLMAAGFGMATTMPAATAAVLEAAPRGRSGLASGLLNATRQAGSAIGVAVLGALVGGSRQFVPGLHVALVLAGEAFLIGLVVALATIRRPVKAPTPTAS